MTQPSVSVLIPCWNAAGLVERALESILAERAIPLECVVVDDGSTDRTLDIVRGVAARDARVVVLALEENKGVSEARNRGLEVVRGDWLTLLDADDRFLPGGLGALAEAALSSDALAVVGQQIWWDGHRQWVTPRYDVADIRVPGRKSLAANPGLLNYVSPHAKLLHRQCWQGLAFEGRVLGDQPWIIRALLRAGDRIDVIGETVYEWYRPAANTPSSSITATTRSDVARGAEAIGVASRALAAVREEAARLLDEPAREEVGRRYAERLLSTDFAAHVARALDRRDAGIGRLFDAIGVFVANLPAGYAEASPALVRAVVEPPLRHWDRLHPAGRDAYWRLLATSLEADPGLTAKASRSAGRRIRLAAGAARSPALRRVATALLILADRRRRLRGRVPGQRTSAEADLRE